MIEDLQQTQMLDTLAQVIRTILQDLLSVMTKEMSSIDRMKANTLSQMANSISSRISLSRF